MLGSLCGLCALPTTVPGLVETLCWGLFVVWWPTTVPGLVETLCWGLFVVWWPTTVPGLVDTVLGSLCDVVALLTSSC